MNQDPAMTGNNEMTSRNEMTEDEVQAVADLKLARGRIRDELGKVIVGQDTVIEQLLMAIFAQGHCVLEGVPGLAKTLMVSTLAQSLQLQFNRIQFTPDLMPSDITGTEVIQEDKVSGTRQFKFLQGPIFANIILADEINRTPPKTQAALLEAMQEHQVTIGGDRHPLPQPFFVLATQNPIEQEGTFSLPEAQQDRFMFKVFVDYPSYDEELQIGTQTTGHFDKSVEKVLNAEDIVKLQQLVRRVPVADHVAHFALRLVRATRVGQEGIPAFIDEWVSWGAGPRAFQNLLLGAKARAVLDGRVFVTTDDIRQVAHPVLRHRIITNYSAESSGINSDIVVDRLLEEVPEVRAEDNVPEQLERAFQS